MTLENATPAGLGQLRARLALGRGLGDDAPHSGLRAPLVAAVYPVLQTPSPAGPLGHLTIICRKDKFKGDHTFE